MDARRLVLLALLLCAPAHAGKQGPNMPAGTRSYSSKGWGGVAYRLAQEKR